MQWNLAWWTNQQLWTDLFFILYSVTTHLAVITRKTYIKLAILKGGRVETGKKPKFLVKNMFLTELICRWRYALKEGWKFLQINYIKLTKLTIVKTP